MRTDLWTCTACGRPFANTHQPHSCGRLSEEAFLEPASEGERHLYARSRELAMACGDVATAPARTRVGFQARMIFAAVNALGGGTLAAHVVLARRLESPRFHRIDLITARCFVHHLRVSSEAELDDEVRGWLAESYEVGEQRARPSPSQESRRL